MRSPTEIKRLEHEQQVLYISNLQTTLLEDPITMLEVELDIATKRDIENAQKKLREMEKVL